MSLPSPTSLKHSSGLASLTWSHSLLLQLPDELLGMIFEMLSFRWMIQMSLTCRRLRLIALSQSTLWQDLPSATVGTLRNLEPFIPYSGALGVDLMIHSITVGELPALCRFLDAHFDKLRVLRLRFGDLPEGMTLDANMLLSLHQTLATRAPLLEVLSLEGDIYESFLGDLRPDILGGTAAPKLWKLSLTAFALAAPCPAFQFVETVVTTIGALSPQSLASPNLNIHDLFPAIQHLQLNGIEAERDTNIGDNTIHRLVRVPVLSAPLVLLCLAWYNNASAGDADDPRAAGWLAASLPHVQQVHVRSLQCAPVSQTVLSSNIEQASVMRLATHGENIEMEFWSDGPQQLRTAILTASQAHAQVETVLRCSQYLRLNTLTISTKPSCLHLLWKHVRGSWDALTGLRTLNLVVDWNSFNRDGWFIALETMERMQPLKNVRTLHLQPPAEAQSTRKAMRKIDPLCMIDLLVQVLPNVETTILHLPDVQLYQPESLANSAICAFYYLSPQGTTLRLDSSFV